MVRPLHGMDAVKYNIFNYILVTMVTAFLLPWVTLVILGRIHLEHKLLLDLTMGMYQYLLSVNT